MSAIIQTVYFADDQRRDTDAFYYTDFTSPMINGEIPMSAIIQTVHFADDLRRDTDVCYYTHGSLRR